MLGDKIKATVKAKYYFGSPVVNATVKYKVTRTKRDAVWFPPAPVGLALRAGLLVVWRRLRLVPGLQPMGLPPTRAPVVGLAPARPAGGRRRGRSRPSAADGTVEIEIDTALAKALHPDSDHNYQIKAEVVDQSRRTIVGTGDVLVARSRSRSTSGPTGHYRVGDTIDVGVAARSLDGKPVRRQRGTPPVEARLPGRREAPQGARSPQVGADDQRRRPRGPADQGLRAGPVSAVVQGHRRRTARRSKGATSSRSSAKASTAAEFRFNDLELVPDKAEYKPGEKVQSADQHQPRRLSRAAVRPARNGVYPAASRAARGQEHDRRDRRRARRTCPTSSSRRSPIAGGQGPSGAQRDRRPAREAGAQRRARRPAARRTSRAKRRQVQLTLTD